MKILLSLNRSQKYNTHININDDYYGFYNQNNLEYIFRQYINLERITNDIERTFYVWMYCKNKQAGWIRYPFNQLDVSTLLSRKGYEYFWNKNGSITFSEESLFRIKLELFEDLLVIQ